MLDFSLKIYEKIYDLALKTNMVACCREYPSLVWNKKRLSFKAVQRIIQKNFLNPVKPCGLYVHFPFCQTRCSFCKYYSEVATKEEIFDSYLNALEQELEFYKIDFSRVVLDNIFLGGGTPTLLKNRQIKRYMEIIYKFFRVNRATQITIEGTPETIDADSLALWRSLGVNRVSLGVQSFNNKILRNIRRNHNVRDIFKAFEIIRKVGIKFIGIDLIWGLPGESRKTYQKTIRDTLLLAPDFIECYLLTSGGRVGIKPYIPSDITFDEAIRLFKEEFLANGYRLYFSGNFFGFIKKGVKRLDAMNRNTEGVYNYRSNCLGIGAGSSSVFPEVKYNIFSNTRNYVENLLKQKKGPIYFGFFINREDYKRQHIISQFGFYRVLDKREYRNIFKTDIKNDFSKTLIILKKNGIVTETKNKLIWHFNESGMGHYDFFWHAMKYWYRPNYIKGLIREYDL